MEKSTKNQNPILVKIAEQLLKDQQELDSLAVQLSLGKAEAKDKLKEIKAELKQKVNDLKTTISAGYAENKEWVKDTIQKLDELEDRLTDNAEAFFEENKKNILNAAAEVESEIKKNPAAQKASLLFATYSEKAKLQLELLEQSIQNKKSAVSESFKEGIDEARKKINAIIERLNEKKDEADLRVEIFKEELDLVYTHLKKAIGAFK